MKSVQKSDSHYHQDCLRQASPITVQDTSTLVVVIMTKFGNVHVLICYQISYHLLCYIKMYHLCNIQSFPLKHMLNYHLNVTNGSSYNIFSIYVAIYQLHDWFPHIWSHTVKYCVVYKELEVTVGNWPCQWLSMVMFLFSMSGHVFAFTNILFIIIVWTL